MLTLFAGMQARLDQLELQMAQDRQINMALFQHLLQHTGVPAFIPPEPQAPPIPLQTPLVFATHSNGLPGQGGLHQQQFASSLPQAQVQQLFTTPGSGLAHSEITVEPTPPFILVPVSTPAASETGITKTLSSSVASSEPQ